MKGSVIRRMYAGFSLIVIMFIITIGLMMNGMNDIHTKFGNVTQSSLPFVSLSNKTSLQLLSSDKLFKDFLTSDDLTKLEQIRAQFSDSQNNFSDIFSELEKASKVYPEAQQHIEQLKIIENGYFSETQVAMNNYIDMFNAESKVAASTRDFQRLNVELTVGMKEMVASMSSISVKLMAKSYFSKLEEASAVTVDALASSDTELVKKAVAVNKKAVSHLNYAFNGLAAQSPEIKEEFQDSVEAFTKDIGKAGGVLDQHYAYIVAQRKLYENISSLSQQVDSAMAIMDHFNQLAAKELNTSLKEAGAIYDNGVMKAVVIGIAVVLLAGGIGYHVAHSVREPLTRILSTLESLANGDISQRIEIRNNNEFSRVSGHINTLADNLHNILTQLNAGSDNLTTATNQNQSTSLDAREQLGHQREKTASVATAMTEMEHSVVEVAQSAQSTTEKVNMVEVAADTGRSVMNSNITTINQLETRLNESVSAVSELQQMSGQIGSILDVIQNIAEQTNLLALNAAIEAARAGEQGRGFAVVADEVRVLAKRTSESTAEIEDMISNLQASSSSASKVIESCMQDMEKSVAQASDANSSMEEIQALILEISQMSTHISQAAAEQSETTSDIARSLEDINHIAEKSHEAMSEIAEVNNNLTQLANEQAGLVHQFKL
ncbi:methyl-accepting chemotaxis protein [Vibrio hannami]|uniref:methyl-accepting chemotaxis protein n=1 Tax=Vibrio hannami TaxID=2717094 RepID=UPI00240FF3AE|nr:methyl-accepting chemotaxis protein [Vibrio hannami]MDG3088418.1 methyl-accepting chemotaxis protein [Vibrio hannami]